MQERRTRVALRCCSRGPRAMETALHSLTLTTKALRDDAARLTEWKHARRVTLKGTPAVDIVTTTPPTLPDAGATATGSKAA